MNRNFTVMTTVCLMLVLAGCAGKGSTARAPTATPTATVAATPLPSPSAPAVSPAATSAPSPAPTAAAAPASTVKPADKPAAYPNIPVDHIVVVVEENHAYSQIIGSDKAPYLQDLVAHGALLTDAHGVTHPSQPNYLALFSGSTQGITDDSCKGPFHAANLATRLIDAKRTFTGYSEDMPRAGFAGCSSKGYARKHNPWGQFTNVPAELNQPLAAFPTDYAKLPTVSFVIPSVENDMHDGSIQDADKWLQDHLGGYVDWANQHRSLLIVTWDEDDFAKANHIPLLFVGPMIKPGKYDDTVNHYHVLRTIEDLYGLEPLGEAKNVQPITSIWK